jgi:hypothetical protein
MDLEDVRERLHDPRVFVAVHLDDVDQRDLRLRSAAERLENWGEFLERMSVTKLLRCKMRNIP